MLQDQDNRTKPLANAGFWQLLMLHSGCPVRLSLSPNEGFFLG